MIYKKKYKLSFEELKLLKLFIYKNCNVAALSRHMHYTSPVVYLRFSKIKKRTGFDPLNFIDLVLLLNYNNVDFATLNEEMCTFSDFIKSKDERSDYSD